MHAGNAPGSQRRQQTGVILRELVHTVQILRARGPNALLDDDEGIVPGGCHRDALHRCRCSGLLRCRQRIEPIARRPRNTQLIHFEARCADVAEQLYVAEP